MPLPPPSPEFALIARHFKREVKGVALGIGDDAALLEVTPGMQLAISADMLVSGRHFFGDINPYDIGFKALSVNLSDLAAMGAVPRWVTLSLALPQIDEAWLHGFAQGFFACAAAFGVELIGGDTTAGPLTIAVQIMGEVPKGRALTRAGARAGDHLWVSGTLGDAALALQHVLGNIQLAEGEVAPVQARLDRPTPRVALGLALRDLASACLDISDGLAGDVLHLLRASGVGAVINTEAVPVSAVMARYQAHPVYWPCVLAGGDDYELLFTAPPEADAALQALAESVGVALHPIGEITQVDTLIWTNHAGDVLTPNVHAFDHFQADLT